MFICLLVYEGKLCMCVCVCVGGWVGGWVQDGGDEWMSTV
jgi:hypothetical protein